MVTIRTCSTLVDAQLMQSLLLGSDIQAFLPDELAAQNTWGAIDGVRVQVSDEDAERAEEILRAAL
jgi:hypothetical protein